MYNYNEMKPEVFKPENQKDFLKTKKISWKSEIK